MSISRELPNQVRRLRQERGWSQAELASRAGISRTAISAIEGERLTPSVAAALSLARCLNCRVEDLFGFAGPTLSEPTWAWPAAVDPSRFWEAEVRGRNWLYPSEPGQFGLAAHDGFIDRGQVHRHRLYTPQQTLVLASCDPAAAMLATEYARTTAFRMLVVPRSSREALRLLADGLVHVAGVHLSKSTARHGNADIVRAELGTGYQLLHVARWEEGIAIGRGHSADSVREVVKSRGRWIGREAGSGARNCLDEVLAGKPTPRRQARDHHGVAEAIRCGWADYGVCVRLVAEESRLKFLSVQQEAYDLVHREVDSADDRIRAMLLVLRSPRYRELLGELPGYDVSPLGEMESCGPASAVSTRAAGVP